MYVCLLLVLCPSPYPCFVLCVRACMRACVLFPCIVQPVDPSEYLYFEVKNKNMTDSKPIGMGKVPLK